MLQNQAYILALKI